MKYSYAKVFGIVTDDDGNKDWGYVSVNLPGMTREDMAAMLRRSVDDIEILSQEQFEREAE